MQKKKRGYLEEQFRLFHLTDRQEMRFEPHCHEFHKILVHITGQVSYTIDEHIYALKPGDILFIPRYQMHYANIEDSLYERYILWISEEYLNRQNEEAVLTHCFKTESHAFHPEPTIFQNYLSLLRRLDGSVKSSEYGAELYAKTLMLQFLIEVNRLTLNETAAVSALQPAISVHIEAAVAYINSHIAENLSIETLAAQLYISPSYLMHRFRQDTGLTVHQYILQKRLFTAIRELKQEQNIGETAKNCGFRDYSTFFRAFKKFFGKTPQEFLKNPKKPLGEQPLRE